jgi:hypothetical protein
MWIECELARALLRGDDTAGDIKQSNGMLVITVEYRPFLIHHVTQGRSAVIASVIKHWAE